MSSQICGLYDEVEVEIWVNNVIQHTADIPSLNKLKEHPDPLNPLGDLPPESTGSHSESSRRWSPRKRSPPKLSPTKGYDQLSDRTSDYTLEFSLQFKTVEGCKKEIEGQLPQLVDDLVNDLYYNAPRGCIPLKLKVSKVSIARYTPSL